LTNAFNINDRGEILAKAAPEGFTPNDEADLGHLALLIPCKEDEWHCENSIERPEILFPQGLAPHTPQLSTPHSLGLRRTMLRRGGLDLRDSITSPDIEEVSGGGVERRDRGTHPVDVRQKPGSSPSIQSQHLSHSFHLV
jgi:hypothetical protein